MAVNKVDINGETVIDLTSDTVTADTLAEGFTAHSSDGELIVGRMQFPDIPTIARTLPEDEDELNVIAGKDWGDGAWLALRKTWREDRGGSFELFSFGEDGADWKSLYGHVNDGLKWGDDYVAMTSDIPSDEHINSLIDAKLAPLEALANEALEVIG